MSAETFESWYEGLSERAQDAVAAVTSVAIVSLIIAAGFGLLVALLLCAGVSISA